MKGQMKGWAHHSYFGYTPTIKKRNLVLTDTSFGDFIPGPAMNGYKVLKLLQVTSVAQFNLLMLFC